MHSAGLVSISFRELTPEQIVHYAKAAGLSCIEWGSDVHAPCKDISKLEQIVSIQNEAGLYCSSYGTYFRIGLHSPDELYDYIHAAKILGTNILRLWCGTKGSKDYTPEEREVFYDQCRVLAKIAEAENVILCMECHNRTMTDSAQAALSLMKAVNSDAFRMYYQPNQFRTEEENIEYARLLAPYTDHIHVFNWKGTERYSLSEGISIWKQYLAQFKGDHTLLLEFMPDNRIETLPKEANSLFHIIDN